MYQFYIQEKELWIAVGIRQERLQSSNFQVSIPQLLDYHKSGRTLSFDNKKAFQTMFWHLS